MNQKIQTIIWAILFSLGVCFAAKAESQKFTSEQTACDTQCSQSKIGQSKDFDSKTASTEAMIAQREDYTSRNELKRAYLGGTVGLFLPSDSDEFDLNNDDFDFDSIDTDNGFGGSVYAGYKFNQFLSADLEFLAFTGNAEPFDSDYTSIGFFINPRYTLPLGNPNASPFIFVSPGIGVAGVGFGDDIETQLSEDGLNTGVALQLKAGAGLPLSESIDLFGQARYFNAFKAYEISNASDEDEQDFSSFSVEAGVNFKL